MIQVKEQIKYKIILIAQSSRETILLSFGLKLDGRNSIYYTGGSYTKMFLQRRTCDAVREPLYTFTNQLKIVIDNRLSSRYYLEKAIRLLNALEGI